MASNVGTKAVSRGTHSGPEFLSELETVSRRIRDPAAKLRYLRASLAEKPRIEEQLNGVPGAPVRKALYRWASLEKMRKLAGKSSVDPRLARSLFLARGMAVLAAASVLAALAGAMGAAFQAGARMPVSVVGAATLPSAPRRAVAPVAEPLPELSAGLAPKQIWLVESGKDYELYSNGLRIDVTYAVAGLPRRYRTFVTGRGMEEEARVKPVGIVFHTTESDVWPLEAGFNENLRGSSASLLRYLKRERLYHYLIDRFGRVFRVVNEDAKANHAGHGTWSDGERFYLSLNNAFLGVSFETRWEGGRALPITEAQLTSGRSLTDSLRQRYDIKPEMCVAHGLTSLNGKKHLIGHHLDWARGFPFGAFGLPDQYQTAPANVAYFGFGYDETLPERMGEPWPGVLAGERAFSQAAKDEGLPVEAFRRQRQDLYDTWQSQQLKDEDRFRAGDTAQKSSGG
jgi:hypothetical protein